MSKYPFQYDYPFADVGEYGQPVIRWTPTPAEVIAKQIAEKIANDREGKLRKALIDLGWTPPPSQA